MSAAFIHMPLMNKAKDAEAAKALVEVVQSSDNPMKETFLVDLKNEFEFLL
jgi:hypothetical protein